MKGKMKIHYKHDRVRLSSSQEKLIAALEKAKWANDVCVSEDPYTVFTRFEIIEDEVWDLVIIREARKPQVSVGTFAGFVLFVNEPEDLFAYFLRIKLEKIAKGKVKLLYEALLRNQNR
jgi:hypothetical protein